MYTNLLFYRAELKNKSITRYKIIGIVSELLLSKKIFASNSEISTFIDNIFNVELKNYVLKSRTLIVAKICRLIYTMENYSVLQKPLLKFVDTKIEQIEHDENIPKQKNDFDGWLK